MAVEQPVGPRVAPLTGGRRHRALRSHPLLLGTAQVQACKKKSTMSNKVTQTLLSLTSFCLLSFITQFSNYSTPIPIQGNDTNTDV